MTRQVRIYFVPDVTSFPVNGLFGSRGVADEVLRAEAIFLVDEQGGAKCVKERHTDPEGVEVLVTDLREGR